MSGGRPATLDSSLLARKGSAAPAIHDESPLVLRLEPNLPEPDEPQTAPEVGKQTVDEGAGLATNWRKDALRWLAAVRPGYRSAAVAAAAVLVGGGLWLANPKEEPPQTDASVSTAVPVAEPEVQGLQLNLTSVPEESAPQPDQVVAPDPPPAAAAMPAAAALAATAPPAPPPAGAPPVSDIDTVEPASGTILPVNVPASEVAPPASDLGGAPEIPATIPKSVSPVPVPKAKPELGGVPAGRYAVQLASIALEGRAQEEAFRLQKQLGAVLGGREIKVERAVVAGKGTRYRLRASGFQSLAEARAACAQAVKLKADCLAIRR
jgi:hypothetical protein